MFLYFQFVDGRFEFTIIRKTLIENYVFFMCNSIHISYHLKVIDLSGHIDRRFSCW